MPAPHTSNDRDRLGLVVAVLALTAVLAATAAGCGGSKSAEEKWADSVCTNLGNWKSQVKQSTDDIAAKLRSPQQGTLAAMKADDHGLTALPFFSGERSTGWHSEARATFTGLNLSADPIEILRALLESVCYRFAAIYERLKAEAPGDTKIIASGGGILNSPVWTQMMADVIGVPVVASAVPEASSRGAAMLALEAFGQIESLDILETPLGKIFEPNARNHELYLRGRARQEMLYDLMIEN